MRRLFALVALLLPLLAAASPGRAETVDPAMAGTFVLHRTASDNVNQAIDVAVARMNFANRPIARGRLRKTNQPYARIVIAFADGAVSTTFDQRKAIVTPLDGSPVSWTREDGERLAVSTEWENGVLEQAFRAEDGQRVNAFSLSPDGKLLTMNVTVTSPRLRAPLTYRLVYARAS